jgi:AbiV family abortive infection protein
MDLRAVRSASRHNLATCAIASARNANSLLHDAEVLSKSACKPRAHSLAVLAVEECGKAYGLTALAVLPRRLRARAPAGQMLQWHQLKQVGGLLLAMVPLGTIASRLSVLPSADISRILSCLEQNADEADYLKRRGFYVDMDRAGGIQEPSQITAAEVKGQLAWAQQAVESASALLSEDATIQIMNPPGRVRELAAAMVEAVRESGNGRTPEAATDVMENAVGKLRAGSAGGGALTTLARPRPGSNPERACARP